MKYIRIYFTHVVHRNEIMKSLCYTGKFYILTQKKVRTKEFKYIAKKNNKKI